MIQSGRKGKVEENSKFVLSSKFVAGLIPDVVAHDELELVRLANLMKCNSLTNEMKGENLLRRIIPKYKPNSKVKAGSASSKQFADKLKLNHSQILRPSFTESQSRGTESCLKLSNISSHSTTKPTTKIKSVKGTTRKVRFDKKVTIHYVPADEERGSFEWRKNLTRQGIYQAMLWKTELENLELEEALNLNFNPAILGIHHF